MVPGKLKLHYSGGVSNTVGVLSLGGAISDHEMGLDIFDNVEIQRLAYGLLDYRCIYIKNVSVVDTSYSTCFKLVCSSNSVFTLALDNSGVNGVADTIPSIADTPSVSAPYYPGYSGLILPDLPPGAHHAVWVKRLPIVTFGVVSVYLNFTITAD